MIGFLTRLMDRHLNPGNNVLPQVRGRFEPEPSLSMLQPTHQLFKEININVETEEKHFSENEEPIKNPDQSIQQNITLRKSVEPVSLSVRKPKNRSVITDFAEKKIEKGIISSTFPLESITKSDDVGNRKRTIPISRKPEYKANVDADSKQIQLTDKSLHTDLSKVNEIPDQEQPGTVPKKSRKETSMPVVKPANLEPGFSQSIKSTKKSEDSSIHEEGVLRTPKWLGEWKTTINQNNEVKVSQSPFTPTIKVNIGRIEVRAVMQHAPNPPMSTEPVKPKLSLDDYLKQRNHKET